MPVKSPLEFFQDLGIDTKTFVSGSHYVQCPKCHDERKNKSAKELLINFEYGYVQCFHCEWTAHILRDRKDNEPIDWTPPPPKPQKFIEKEPAFNWIVPDVVVEPEPIKPMVGKYHVTFYYRNIDGKLTGAKKVLYNFPDYKRDHDAIPLHLFTRDSGYYACLFNERDLSIYPNAKVVLVESEKTAGVLRKKFQAFLEEFVYLATGGANGLSEEKVPALKNRDVLIVYDCDNGEPDGKGGVKNPKGREGAITANLRLAGVAKSSRVIDLDPSRNDGTDLADIIKDVTIDTFRSMRGGSNLPPGLIEAIRKLNVEGARWTAEAALELAKEFLLHHDKIYEIGRSYYANHRDEHNLEALPLLKKIEYFLLSRFEFRRNAFTKKINYRAKEESDFKFCNYNDIWRLLQHNLLAFGGRTKITITDVSNLLESNFIKETNPFVDYFHSLPHWDGTDHITALANHVSCDQQQFWVAQFKKALVRMIACTYGGIENRIIMVFVQERQNSGKCLGRGTKVIMADWSLKYVEDIKPGDQVMGVDGTPRNVLEIHSGIDQMYWVRQSNGMDYRVNSNHILSLKRRQSRVQFSDRNEKKDRIINIHLNQYLRLHTEHKFRLMGWKPSFDFEPQDVPIDPYFLGLWIGDGSSTSISITTADKVIEDYIYQFASDNKMFVTPQQKRNQPHNKAKTYFLVHTKGIGQTKRGTHTMLKTFRNMGLLGNKHIPDLYLKNSREVRLKVLAGIIDTDGHLDQRFKGVYEVTFKSYRLAKDLEFLCRTLGFRSNTNKKKATMRRKDGSIYECDVYRTTIYGSLYEVPVLIKRKKAIRKISNIRPCLLTGITIEEDRIDEYFGFTTDGDQLFMLEDFTVTHNSSFLRFLCPPALRDYYKEDPMQYDKDTEIALSQNFMWNLEELAQLNKKEVTELKAIISRQKVKQRRAYGRQEESMTRIVNFWGSTNKEEFLTDSSNTRWLCFKVNSISFDYNNYTSGKKNIDINKVWAQAWHLYKSGFQYTLDGNEQEQRDINNKQFEMMTEEKQLMLKFLTQCKDDDPQGEFMMNAEIHEYLILQTNSKLRLSPERIGTSMTQLGFAGKMKKVNGKPVRGYYVIKKPLAKEVNGFNHHHQPPEREEPPSVIDQDLNFFA